MLTSISARLAVLALLTACQSSASPLVGAPTCAPGWAFDGTSCRAWADRRVERMSTPFMEGGRPVTLELVSYRPLTAGPYPTLVFHHGSTGNGDNPALFGQTYTSDAVARVFVEQGWMVLFPQRRGRGASDGVYDEGFEPDRSRYSCRRQYALPGVEHALDDARVITDHVRARADVDPARLLLGGVSRGGILALAHHAREPLVYRGVVNFVGGWLGEACADAVPVNRITFEQAGAASRPSLWLYGENDPFYSVNHSRKNFEAFVAAGGTGSFHTYRRSNATANGHFVLNEPALWRADLQAFLDVVLR